LYEEEISSMDQRTKKISLTTGVIVISIILVVFGLLGFNLVLGLFLICAIWGLYFYLMTR